jgi:transcriptional regulator with XRE-family HTH domain
MDKYKFGNRFYELRKEHGYTQEKLGKKLGVSNKAISKWENGESFPRLPMLDKIAACFDMTAEQLLEYNDNSDTTGKKELNSSIPDEIMNLPRFTVRFLMGLGWVQVDAEDFLNTIKTESGVTNSELSTIIGVSEKKIGLWENGIKKPSPRESLRIAALYYNNCDDAGKANKYSDVAQHIKLTLKEFSAFLVFALAMTLFVYTPISIIGEVAIRVIFTYRIPSFSLKVLFALVLPTSLGCFVSAVILKSVKLNRPNITKTIKGTTAFQVFFFVYLLIIINLLHLPAVYTVCVIIYYAITLLIEKIIRLKEFRNYKTFICIIPSGIILIAYASKILSADFYPPAPEAYRLAINEINLFNALMPLVMFTCITILRQLLINTDAFAKKLTVLFPNYEREYIPVSKRDKILVITGIALTVVFGVLIELFRRELFEIFLFI